VTVDAPKELAGATITRAVGEELRRTREARGWSRAHFVELLPSRIGERTVLAYEHGMRQLTLLRLAELSWALEVDPSTVFTRGLQRARVLVESVPLEIDLRALLQDGRAKFRPLRQWVLNMLNELPGGVVEVEPAVVRNLAAFIGCSHRDLADYLARFAVEDGNADDVEIAERPL
jgi:transcriptional regulator with XRE-family HTH domain